MSANHLEVKAFRGHRVKLACHVRDDEFVSQCEKKKIKSCFPSRVDVYLFCSHSVAMAFGGQQFSETSQHDTVSIDLYYVRENGRQRVLLPLFTESVAAFSHGRKQGTLIGKKEVEGRLARVVTSEIVASSDTADIHLSLGPSFVFFHFCEEFNNISRCGRAT